MSLIRAQVVFPGRSNLPEDRFVNTLHFDGTPGTDYTPIAGKVAGFYNYAASFPPGNIAQYMTQWILRDACQVRLYDMTTAEPRVPTVVPFTLAARTEAMGHQDLPEECAVVASFTGSPPVTARRRGRIYVGPLNTLAMSEAGNTLPSRVDTTFTTLVSAQMKWLQLECQTIGVDWVIWSPTSSTSVPVIAGWCDNAIDIQRRRGPKPTSRVPWTSVLP